MTRLYERPQSLDQALDLLPQEDWTILAGGTDIYPASAEAYAWGHPTPCHILDVTAISSLSSIEETPEAFRIGCLATWTELIEAELPNWFKALRFERLDNKSCMFKQASRISHASTLRSPQCHKQVMCVKFAYVMLHCPH